MFEYYWATNSTFDLQRSFTRKGCTVRITQLYMGTFDNAVMEYLSVLHVTLVTHQAVCYPLHPLPGVIGTQIAWYPIQTPRPQKRATRNARYPVRPLPNTSLYHFPPLYCALSSHFCSKICWVWNCQVIIVYILLLWACKYIFLVPLLVIFMGI